MASLFQKHPRIQSLILMPDPARHSWWKRFMQLKSQLRGFGADGIVFLHPDSACQVAAWSEGIPIRLGFQNRFWTWTLTQSLPYRKSEGVKHESEYNFDLLALWGLPCPEALLNDITVEERSELSLLNLLPWDPIKESFVVLNPSAFSEVARWPVHHFVALAESLLTEKGLRIVVTGDSETDPSACEICHRLQSYGNRILNLAGRTSLGELGALLKHAEVLVTRDTGPSHLAAAVGCPVTVIFGRNDPIYGPTRWRPLGERVEALEHRQTRRQGEKKEAFWQRCFASIEPTEVLDSRERVRIPKM